MQSSKKFYVTTPIYYVNAKPHLGSLYSTVLADVAARWNQLQGKKTFLLTGTDEHGQKIAQSAQAAGKEPKAFIDGFIESFKDTWKAYEIEYNHFIRTTDPEHVKAVQAWIIQLKEKGDIYKGAYQGYYCTPCETFVTEKDMAESTESTGPDVKPACPSCSRATVYMEEECYFFKLSAYQDRLLEFYEKHPDFITPSERAQEVISFVKAGLKDLSISRTTISWGIPFPGDEKHVCYVWADALNNYISAIGYADPARQKEFEFWWPADLQVLGKDIVRFHAVYWPAFLMAADLAMPHKLLVHGWIKIGGQKMSKSLGNVVDPQQLLHKYGPDAVRYYLTRYIAVTQDSPFTIEELEQHINADLVNDLGNLLNRMLMLAQKNGLHEIKPVPWSDGEIALHELCTAMIAEFAAEMEQCMYHRAYAHLWKYINIVNAYFHAQEPWKVVKTDPARFAMIISATAHALYAIGLLAWPVMPQKMAELLHMLGTKHVPGTDYLHELAQGTWDRTFTITLKGPLFMKIMPEESPAEQKQEAKSETPALAPITIDEFAKVALLVGTITKVDTIEKSDKLYALTVDLGEHGVRTVCSGVRQHFTPEELLQKQGVFVANLQPRQMMGLTSQGMMLFAKDAAGKLKMATVAGVVPNGTRLS